MDNNLDLNNPEFVSPWSPCAEWKRALLVELGRMYGIRTLVETGTCYGGTIAAVKNHFDQIYSVELQKELYETAAETFRDYGHVHLYFGNSASKLSEVLSLVSGPVLFWLDAHVAGPGTADEGDPLPQELRVIFERKPDSLILIDDIKPDYETWDNLQILREYPEWEQIFLNGVLILQRGQYEIPERF